MFSSGSSSVIHLERQRKQCGHECFPSTTVHCCPCSDLRPHRVGDTYPIYVDGVGWCETGCRDEGYCPVCNPKNYDAWIETIEIQHKEKQRQKEVLQRLLEEQNIHANEDMLHIYSEIGDKKGKFLYTNGDEYEGEFVSGQRHGYGVMIYASDNAVYTGDWKQNQQHGFGIKNWGDGIVYDGEWKEDMMHGKGRYTLSCGTIIEGMFECDEFAE